jgi:hypothetical protein
MRTVSFFNGTALVFGLGGGGVGVGSASLMGRFGKKVVLEGFLFQQSPHLRGLVPERQSSFPFEPLKNP